MPALPESMKKGGPKTLFPKFFGIKPLCACMQ